VRIERGQINVKDRLISELSKIKKFVDLNRKLKF